MEIDHILLLFHYFCEVFFEEKCSIELEVSLCASDDRGHHVEGGTMILSPQLSQCLVSSQVLSLRLVASSGSHRGRAREGEGEREGGREGGRESERRKEREGQEGRELASQK